MRLVGHLIVRLFQTMAGLGLGLVAAALVLVLSVANCCLEPGASNAGLEAGAVAVLAAAAVTSAWLAVIAAGPAVLAIVLAEAARLKGMVSNLFLGALVAAATAWLATGGDTPQPSASVAVLAAGFAGGFVYWLVSGRSAGAWLEPGDPKAM